MKLVQRPTKVPLASGHENFGIMHAEVSLLKNQAQTYGGSGNRLRRRSAGLSPDVEKSSKRNHQDKAMAKYRHF